MLIFGREIKHETQTWTTRDTISRILLHTVHMYLCICVCTYVSIHVCTYIYTYMSMYYVRTHVRIHVFAVV